LRRRELGAILECVTFVADVELDIGNSSLSGGSDHPIDFLGRSSPPADKHLASFSSV